MGAGVRFELTLNKLMRLVSLPIGLPRYRGWSMLRDPFYIYMCVLCVCFTEEILFYVFKKGEKYL